MRSVLAVQVVFADMPLQICYQPPSKEGMAMVNLMLELFVQRPHAKKGKPVSAKRIQKDQQMRDEYRTMINCHPAAPLPTHYCHAISGCRCGGEACGSVVQQQAITTRRCSKAMLKTGYTKKPTIAQVKEWTNVGEAMNWLAFILNANGIGFAVFSTAVTRIKPHAVNAAQALLGRGLEIVPAPDLSQCFERPSDQADIESMSWHALVGKRIKYIREHLMNAAALFVVTLLAVLVGAEETIAFRFLAKRVTLSSYAYVKRNPALQILQFFSSILAGEHAVVALICGTKGCETFRELARIDAAAAHLVRCSTVSSSSAADLRHIDRMNQFPWPLAVIGDPNVPDQVQEDSAYKMYTYSNCRLDPGIGRVLRARVGTDFERVRDIGVLSPPYQHALGLWSKCHDCHTFDLECGHGHNKARTHILNTWDIIFARCVNAEAKARGPQFTPFPTSGAPPPPHGTPVKVFPLDAQFTLKGGDASR